MAGISDDLRAELGKAFVRGFLDYSAGTPVEDDDEIPSALGLPLIQMAKQCIANAEPILVELFRENPQLTYDHRLRGRSFLCRDHRRARSSASLLELGSAGKPPPSPRDSPPFARRCPPYAGSMPPPSGKICPPFPHTPCLGLDRPRRPGLQTLPSTSCQCLVSL